MWTNRNGIWHTSINKKWTSTYIKPHRKRIGQSKPLESKCCWVQGLSFNDPKIVNQTEMGPASVYFHTWMPDVLRTSESLGPILSKWVLICFEFHSNWNATLRWDEPWSLLCLSFRKSKHVSMFDRHPKRLRKHDHKSGRFSNDTSKRSLRHRNDTFPSPPSHLLVHYDVRTKMVCLFVG